MSEANEKFNCLPILIAVRKDNVSVAGVLEQGQKCLNCIDENFKTNSTNLKKDRKNMNDNGLLKPKACKKFVSHCSIKEGCSQLRNCKGFWQTGHNVFMQLDGSKALE